MNMQFKNLRIAELSLKAASRLLTEEELNNEMSFTLGYNKNGDKDFSVVFNISIENLYIQLKAIAIASFETDEVLDTNFIASPFVKINAPAIAYPYLRTFISNITLNAGYQPIMLPTLNFVKLAEEKETNN